MDRSEKVFPQNKTELVKCLDSQQCLTRKHKTQTHVRINKSNQSNQSNQSNYPFHSAFLLIIHLHGLRKKQSSNRCISMKNGKECRQNSTSQDFVVYKTVFRNRTSCSAIFPPLPFLMSVLLIMAAIKFSLLIIFVI